MAHHHRVCDARAAGIRVGTWELPFVRVASETSIGASNIAARVTVVADIGAVGSNDLHLLDPTVRRNSMREGKGEHGHLEGGHHAERQDRHGSRDGLSNVVCWKFEERRKALSQQGCRVFGEQ
jgi:hypothetical protein